jgi:hypothetical protein
VVARWKLKIFFRAFGAAEKGGAHHTIGGRAVRVRPDSPYASHHGPNDGANSKEDVCCDNKLEREELVDSSAVCALKLELKLRFEV